MLEKGFFNEVTILVIPRNSVKKICEAIFFSFYQNIDYNVETNNLQLTKINQNNMIKMSQKWAKSNSK